MRELAPLRDDAIEEVHLIVGRYYGGVVDTRIEDVEALCEAFLLLATASLFADGNPQMYFTNLCRAAENWRRLHTDLLRRGEPLPAASRNTPFLGAVAAGATGLAQELVRSARTDRDPTNEYEVEFALARVLHRLVDVGAHPDEELWRLLSRVSDAAAGSESVEARVELITALVERNAERVRSAFDEIHLLHEADVEARAANFTTPKTGFVAHRYLWLEGLAFLRLAKEAGCDPAGNYRYCPSLARGRMTNPYRGDWVLPIGGEPRPT